MYMIPKCRIFVLVSLLALVGCTTGQDGTGKKAAEKKVDSLKNLQKRNTPNTYEATPDYLLDLAASKVTWKGYKLSGKPHTGTINVAEGGFEVREGKIVAGRVLLDLATLKVTDLTDKKLAVKLENHLKSQDFFYVNHFRTAELMVLDISNIEADSEGNNAYVIGDLSIRDETHPARFSAKIDLVGDKITASGDINVNRTAYGIRYGSDKFMGHIADQIIKDEFDIHFDLVANKKK